VLERDGELVQRAASGDAEAFTEIFQRYQPVVRRLARGMTRCPAAAEDLSQEVFVTILCDLARYDPSRATFTTYLYGIVRNLSRERLRKEWRFSHLDILSRGGVHPMHVDNPSDALEDLELTLHLRRGLRNLPQRHRQLIVLCDLHGFSYAEAAHVVGISTSTVRSRLHRARQLLRARLAPLLKPRVHLS
jgi:RNA polymerase sigma-70 factor (ECF subfamily)